MCLSFVLDNLFEVVNKYLQLHEVATLVSTSKYIRIILVPDEKICCPVWRRTTICFGSISDWLSCSAWMSRCRFTLESIIFEDVEEVVTYFKSSLCDPTSYLPRRILYRGENVSKPLIAIADDALLRRVGRFSNCAENCFSTLYHSNLAYNTRETDCMENNVFSTEISIAVVSPNDVAYLSSSEQLNFLYIRPGDYSIGVPSFRDHIYLTSVVLSKGLTSIGDHTFSKCMLLSYLVLPEGLKSIGRYAFCGCLSLSSVVLPEGLISLGHSSFAHCSSLSSILIPEGIVTIDNCAFADCSVLSSVILPDGLTKIGNYAFSGCSSLSSIVIPEGITSVGHGTFYGCSVLSSVILPEGLTSIGNFAFSNCSSLSNIVLPEGLIRIGNSAFSGCSSLASIVLPEGMTHLGDSAFVDCSSLSYMVLPEGLSRRESNFFGLSRFICCPS
jgi:hypothetical protein